MKNLQEIQKRLGLHRLNKTPAQGGFGDGFESTKSSKSNLGFVVVKKKRKLESAGASSSPTPAKNSRQDNDDARESVENLSSDVHVTNEALRLSNSVSDDLGSNKSDCNENGADNHKQGRTQTSSSRTSYSIPASSHIDEVSGEHAQEVKRSTVTRTGSEEPKNTKSLLLCDYGSSSSSDSD